MLNLVDAAWEFWKYQAVLRGAYKFPDFFRMGTFIDSSHMKL